MADEDPPQLPPVDPAAAGVPSGSLTPELLASLLVEGDDELAAWVLRHALAERSRAEVFDDLLAGAMAIIGERWADGRWSVAEEHLASQTILRALDRIRPQQGPEGRIGPLAVLAAVAGEHHMIALVCLDQVLRERGWTVATLGADVPADDLGTYVGRYEAALVALTASDPARLQAVIAAIGAVRAIRPDVAIVLGGRLAAQPNIAATLGIDRAVSTLVEAASVADGVAAAVVDPDPAG
jgi:methanogenic corrinoid protein MtbC1